MKLADPSMALFTVCAGDTVRLFDVSYEADYPCTLTYAPSPGCFVNSLKWNHTNLVVASAGDDKKISLWRNNGQSLGTIPVSGTDSGDGIEESITAINFSNKSSRYICTGGSGRVVRIWDLQRKRCIKWFKGHTDTITGVAYNCRDEHLASISLKGDLILYNLTSRRTTECKDPHEQVLRVLDYSRISRHALITGGDDGSMHLWDTTGHSLKVSWLRQHSAPITGMGFSPSDDKIIASVGLDKKLYLYDSGSRRPTSCIPYESPFNSLSYRDDGLLLAAGTSNGRVVFYDVRRKSQPLAVLHAYHSSEAVSSLCWQRSKPVGVSETCSAEVALLGNSVEEDSVLMPDTLPSVATSNNSNSTSNRPSGQPGLTSDSFSLTATKAGSIPDALNLSTSDDTPQRNPLWLGGKLSKLHAPRSGYNFKDDMEVFSPLVDVHPVTPSLDKLWDARAATNKDQLPVDKRPSSLLFPSSMRFPFKEEGLNDRSTFDWKSSLTSKQEDVQSSFLMLDSSPNPSSKAETASIMPPEALGVGRFSEKFNQNRHSVNLTSHIGSSTSSGLNSGSMFSGLHDSIKSTSYSSTSSLTGGSLGFGNLLIKTDTSGLDIPSDFIEDAAPSNVSTSLTAKSILGQSNFEFPGVASLNPQRRFSTYAERISTSPAFADGTFATGSPKTKKTGAETRDELLNSLLSRSDISSTGFDPGNLLAKHGRLAQTPKSQGKLDSQNGSSFTHQLIQHTLEETLSSFQKSIHGDMRNLHIEILRQFHIQEMEFSSVMGKMLENQAELTNEVKALRKEIQQLRHLL